jgi:hypothetical protein
MIAEPTDKPSEMAIYMRGRRWSTYGPTRPAAAAPDTRAMRPGSQSVFRLSLPWQQGSSSLFRPGPNAPWSRNASRRRGCPEQASGPNAPWSRKQKQNTKPHQTHPRVKIGAWPGKPAGCAVSHPADGPPAASIGPAAAPRALLRSALGPGRAH